MCPHRPTLNGVADEPQNGETGIRNKMFDIDRISSWANSNRPLGSPPPEFWGMIVISIPILIFGDYGMLAWIVTIGIGCAYSHWKKRK